MATLSFMNWLRLRDFDDALLHARVAVIKRIARGNVSFQNGNVLDEVALDQLRAEGDRAITDLIAQKKSITKNGGDIRLQGSAEQDSQRMG